jgi:hypothetical protein
LHFLAMGPPLPAKCALQYRTRKALGANKIASASLLERLVQCEGNYLAN